MATPHPVKRETFDTDTYVNIDPKGFSRTVDSYRETDFGLYMARGADHPRFGYLESWLLPDLGVRISIFHERTRPDQWNQDYYVDIARVHRPDDATNPEPGVWTTEDIYLDLSCKISQTPEVLDTDEILDAVLADIIPPAEAQWALDTAFAAAMGIAEHNGDPVQWAASHGYELTWASSVELVPAVNQEVS